MTLDFTGKVAIVTGASRGIGRAVATTLAAAGASVVAAARGSNADETVSAIAAAGGLALAVAADVTDAASVQAMVDRTLERFGRIDVLVNNAGITRDQLLLRLKREEWDEVLATNLTGAFPCTQAVVRPMIRQRGGRDRLHQLGRRSDGECRPGELRRVEGRVDRVRQVSRARGGVAQRHGERRSAGADRRPT